MRPPRRRCACLVAQICCSSFPRRVVLETGTGHAHPSGHREKQRVALQFNGNWKCSDAGNPMNAGARAAPGILGGPVISDRLCGLSANGRLDTLTCGSAFTAPAGDLQESSNSGASKEIFASGGRSKGSATISCRLASLATPGRTASVSSINARRGR